MPTTETDHPSPGQDPSPHAGPDAGGAAGETSAFRDIICAVDGTLGSTAAVRLAASLAAPDGHLTLLAVTAVAGSGDYETADISPSRAERLLSSDKRIAAEAGVRASAVIDPRSPAAEVILERAAEHELLAIGPPGTWLSEMIVGGTAKTMLSRFTTPMLVVRQPYVDSLHRRQILIASDGGEGSDRLIELGARIARSQDARVRLVNALGSESTTNPRAIRAQAQALARAVPDAGEPHIEPGRPWEVIAGAAAGSDAALIILASRRLAGLRALGSVSRRAVYEAPCAVLVVPPSA